MFKTKTSSILFRNYNVYFFFALLIFITLITFYIFQPFLTAIFLAAILAVIFQNIYRFFLKFFKGKESLSALITSLIILLLIIIPLTLVVVLVGRELIVAFQNISNGGDFYQNYLAPFVTRVKHFSLYNILNLDQFFSRDSFGHVSSQLGQVFLTFLQSSYENIAHVVFLIFVMFFTLYYFFIDGKNIVAKLMYISPLKNSHEKMLIEKFVSITRATIKGNLTICILQGLIGASTFFIAGIGSAITWGVVMMLCSLIPLFGSGLVWLPAALIMLFLGHVWQGFFILAVGFGVMSTLDNVIKPRLVGKDIKVQMHPLLIFFATLGGLGMFGFIGFILGPVIVALFVALWEIYGVEFKSQLKRYNA